tara:strand:- start:503 stop:958 length:456 start_codon:yes stop_codon:yes gene_type:complete
MVEVRLVIGDAKSKKTYQKTVDGDDAKKFIGKKIGDKIRGETVDLKGYELEVTGGSDSSGFPMRKGVHGQGRKKILTTPGIGFRGKEKNKKKVRVKHGGLREKKTVHGEVISDDISQINCKVVKQGTKSLEELFKKEEPKPEGGDATEAKA